MKTKLRIALLAVGALGIAFASNIGITSSGHRRTVSLPTVSASETRSMNRAAVVIDTGQSIKRVCVGFSTDSISGLDVVKRASGVNAVIRSYSGQGGAICSMCGVGCAADSSCLTCGGSNYWSYFRSPAGSNKFSYSPIGAASSRVRNGDIEGWRWGPGKPPDLPRFADVCSASSPRITTTTTVAASKESEPTATTNVAGVHEEAGPDRETTSTLANQNTATTATEGTVRAGTVRATSDSSVSSTTIAKNETPLTKTATSSGINIPSIALLVIAFVALGFSFVRTRKQVKAQNDEDDDE